MYLLASAFITFKIILTGSVGAYLYLTFAVVSGDMNGNTIFHDCQDLCVSHQDWSFEIIGLLITVKGFVNLTIGMERQFTDYKPQRI